MCLSTVYERTMSPDTVLMRNVVHIECREDLVILTDLMQRQMGIEGKLKEADLTEGWVIVETTE